MTPTHPNPRAQTARQFHPKTWDGYRRFDRRLGSRHPLAFGGPIWSDGDMDTTGPLDPIALLRPRRRIEGASAILLPFDEAGDVDWPSFAAHAIRTAEAGLTPAVNMDTGYVNLIGESGRAEVLRRTREALGGASFLAGAFVGDRPGNAYDPDAYRRAITAIEDQGGTPVIFQSYGLTALDDDAIVDAYAGLGRACDRFVAFELGSDFAPFGRIYSMEVYRGLLGVRQCVGAKHSSLQREPEWLRLIERDKLRPDFRVYTGNDLAIDMVMYGSDYLLGPVDLRPRPVRPPRCLLGSG